MLASHQLITPTSAKLEPQPTSIHAPLFLGIDGGGSHCRAWLEHNNGQLLGQGQAGPANPVNGYQQALEAIVASAEQALTAAGLARSMLSQLVVGAGLAGLHLPSMQQKLASWQHPFAKLYLTTDLDIAALGAFGQQDGAVIILGTGFSALGVVAGQSLAMGGFGFPINCTGSGSGFGLEAVKLALLAADGLAEPSLLTAAVFAGRTPQQLAEAMLPATPGQYAQLAPLVFQCAEQGDVQALHLIQQAATFIDKVSQRFLAAGVPQISMIGGVAPRLLPFLKLEIQQKIQYQPAASGQGALLFARQQWQRQPEQQA